MAKKSVKGGEKGKAAEPKAAPVQAYDLDVISKQDLNKYIASLEKELALMRKDCAFYSTNRIKIAEFLDARRNEFMSEKRMSVINNRAMDDAIERLRQIPVKYNELKVFRDRENVRRKLENVFEDFVANSIAEANHLDVGHVLKQQIADKNKRLESDQFFCEMTLMDMKESYQGVLEDTDVKFGKKLEGILMDNFNKCLKGNQEFSAEKIRKLISIWNIGDPCCSSETEESYISEMNRMQDFFHEISSNNSEVIKILRKKLADLRIENQKTNFNLKQVLQQNVHLRDLQPATLRHPGRRDTSARIACDTGNFPDQKLFKLQYVNEALHIQLRSVKTDLRNLKRQFIAATRKVYQKAEFKAFMTEEMIRMTLQMESLKSRQDDKVIEKYEEEIKDHEEKSNSTDIKVNTLNLSVERSDTLFVPPVYHEFWNPRVKYSLN